MIHKETIDRIFETARIEDVVSDFVVLKKKGANLLGNCPFHNEKTPSFTVSPSKGIYKCFGCGKGGNAVNFIMDHEHLTYPDALKYLAAKYKIEIEEKELSPEQLVQNTIKESLYAVTTFAQKYFSEQLLNSEEGKAIGLSYFTERGFSLETIQKFQLGFSPENRNALSEAAVAAGYKEEFLSATGLSVKNDYGLFDRFHGRVIFPIHNATGKVIGFGGRVLRTDKKTAKYLNSPESEIYHKSKVLYGLFYAKKTIINENNCFLVEGYTDVISLHQCGIENVVSSSGTSLTVEQIQLIRRFCDTVTVMYDGDAAGIKASFRGIDMLLEEGLNVKVLLFPDGEDPDSYSKKTSIHELREFIKKNTKDFISFKTGILLKDTEGDPIKKAGLIRDIVNSISLIPDLIARSVYVKECSRLLEIDEQTLLSELNKIRREKLSKKLGDDVKKEDVFPEEQYTAPAQIKAEQKNHLEVTSDHWERETLRLFLQYGGDSFVIEHQEEDGSIQKLEVSVAEYIIHSLSNDGISFKNDQYSKLLNEMIVFSETQGGRPQEHFINHQDPEISRLTIDIISSPYALSEGWESKHKIQVSKESEQLRHAVETAIFSLKKTRILEMIKTNQDQLSQVSEEEQTTNLIIELQLLNDLKKTFASALGRVILR